MKKIYSVEFTDTLVAVGIILAFFALMAIIALFTGM
jgi:hypothetical protein